MLIYVLFTLSLSLSLPLSLSLSLSVLASNSCFQLHQSDFSTTSEPIILLLSKLKTVPFSAAVSCHSSVIPMQTSSTLFTSVFHHNQSSQLVLPVSPSHFIHAGLQPLLFTPSLLPPVSRLHRGDIPVQLMASLTAQIKRSQWGLMAKGIIFFPTVHYVNKFDN